MINYIAIVVAAVIVYVIGAVWYSPLLFGKQWMKLQGFTKKNLTKAKKRGMAKAYILTFAAVLVMTWVLGLLVEAFSGGSFAGGMIVGFWVWLGFLATTQIGMVFWENKPFSLYLLNTAHYLVVLALAGGILAVWG